jgi:hypothetical protein
LPFGIKDFKEIKFARKIRKHYFTYHHLSELHKKIWIQEDKIIRKHLGKDSSVIKEILSNDPKIKTLFEKKLVYMDSKNRWNLVDIENDLESIQAFVVLKTNLDKLKIKNDFKKNNKSRLVSFNCRQ